jgi:hypothetical protein
LLPFPNSIHLTLSRGHWYGGVEFIICLACFYFLALGKSVRSYRKNN